MTEIYKDVPGYEKSYQVSNLGNVRSLDRVASDGRKLKGKLIRLQNHFGYRSVTLSKDSEVKTFTVHKLVMASFIGPRPDGLDIDHWDENKANNKLSNLSYMTKAENNYRSRKNMTSTHRGVSWRKSRNMWRSQIKIDGKMKWLGLFTDELEAAKCYQDALKNFEAGLPIEVKKPNFSSKHRGVGWHKASNKWQASIRIDGKKKYLGLFKTELEAVEVLKNFKNNLK